MAFLQNHDQIGNRAFGERLTELTPPEKLDLARAALLLLPQIPMLFMGEEWGAPTPFLYFVDFSTTRFSKMPCARDGNESSRTSNRSGTVPAIATSPTRRWRTRSFDRGSTGPSRMTTTRAMLDDTRRLLALRRSDVIPILQSRYLGAEHNVSPGHALDVTWRFAGGTLRFCANFGASQADVAADENWRTSGRVRP